MNRRLTATAAVSGALALSLTGCLGDAGNKAGDVGGAVKLAASQVMAKVSDKAGRSDTYRSRIISSGDLTIGDQKVNSSMEMTMQVRMSPTFAMKGVMKTRIQGGPQLPGMEQPMEMIMVGDAMYMKAGPAMAKMSGGKPWARMSFKGATGGLGGGDLLKQAQRTGPAEQSKLLTGSKDVHEVGKETIDGVETTHYAGTVDLKNGFGNFDGKTQKKFKELYDGLGADRTNIELWIGPDNLPRKQVTNMTMSMGTMKVTAFFSDYGKPVSISAPPANQVGEFKMP